MYKAQRAYWKGRLYHAVRSGSFLSIWPNLMILFAWNHRKLVNSLLTLYDKSEGGFEPRTLWTRVKWANHSAISYRVLESILNHSFILSTFCLIHMYMFIMEQRDPPSKIRSICSRLEICCHSQKLYTSWSLLIKSWEIILLSSSPGPDEDIPRPMECFEFVSRAPTNLFKLRTSYPPYLRTKADLSSLLAAADEVLQPSSATVDENSYSEEKTES